MAKAEVFVTPGYGPKLRDLLHYSQVLKIGDRVEISGQGGWNDDLEIPDTIEAEIEQAFRMSSARWLQPAQAGRTWFT